MNKKLLTFIVMLVLIGSLMIGCTVKTIAANNAEETTTSEEYIPSETEETVDETIDLVAVANEVEPVQEEEEIVLEITTYILVDASEITTSEQASNFLIECKVRLKSAKQVNNGLKKLGYDKDHPARVLARKEIKSIKKDISYYQEIYESLLVEEERIAEEEAARIAAEEEAARQEAERIAIEEAAAATQEEVYIQETQPVGIDWGLKEAQYPIATAVWQYLKSLGYNDYVCAGIMGNLMVETGGYTLNLDVYCWYHNAYYGLLQWSMTYYPQIANADLYTQLNFLANTIQAEYNEFGYLGGYGYSDFLSLQNEQVAALSFAKTYERCGSGSYGMRQSLASEALNYFTH